MNSNITSDEQAVKAGKIAKKRAVKVDPELLFQLRSYVQEAGPTLRNIIEMGPLLKDITEVQHIQNVANTTAATPATAQQATPQATIQEPTASATAPAPMPSSTTSIAPAGATVTTPDDNPEDTDELARVRKNAGIVVESN
jgi:hypothetical protein